MEFFMEFPSQPKKTQSDNFVNKLIFIEFFSQNGNEGRAVFSSVLNDNSIIKPVMGISFIEPVKAQIKENI